MKQMKVKKLIFIMLVMLAFISCRITPATRTSNNDNLSGTILLDKTSIELFYDNGETVMTEIFFPNAPYDKLSIESKNQEFVLDNIEVHELKFNLN